LHGPHRLAGSVHFLRYDGGILPNLQAWPPGCFLPR